MAAEKSCMRFHKFVRHQQDTYLLVLSQRSAYSTIRIQLGVYMHTHTQTDSVKDETRFKFIDQC